MKVREPDLILVVDDDVKIAHLVEAYLERAGYRVAIAHDGLTGLKMIRELSPALVVLDLMLPDLDGRAVARTALEESDISIIMLTALGSTAERISGLVSGADDYLAKPFAPSELVARIGSVLRRARPPRRSTPLRYGDLMVDPGRRLASLCDRPLELTASEFDLLHALVQARGRVLTREQLTEAVSKPDSTTAMQDRSIDVYILRLRSKLGRPNSIATVHGIGYRLAGA